MSTLRVTTLQNTSGVEVYTAKAWVNFNGTGTVAIRASGNVSSITDNGAGDYTINFTTAMADANYSACWSASTDTAGSNSWSGGPQTRTASSLRLATQVSTNAGFSDPSSVNVAIFR